MSIPPLSLSIHPCDQHRVMLQIQSGDGVWELPVPKEQAKLLAEQILSAVSDEESTPEQDLERFFEHALVRLPFGTLWMGGMPGDDVTSDALPRHAVDVQGFQMAMIPVTQGLWFHVMGGNPSEYTGSNKPVHNITWYEAVLFCNTVSEQLGLNPVYTIGEGSVDWDRTANGFRLPTEMEWEYASRTRDDLQFSGGDQIEMVGWTVEQELKEMPNVAQKNPNLWGFHDMSGLVFEWWWDEHKSYQSDEILSSGTKVCRGGSWKHEAVWARCTTRYPLPQDHRGMVGLRLVRNIES